MRRVEFTRLVAASLGAATLVGYGLSPAIADAAQASAQTPAPDVGASSVGTAPTYDDAVQTIKALIAVDDADATLEKVALPRLYEHGSQTTNAIVLFHGFTNCPQQFDQIAHEFYDRGFNVYVPRIPRHGKADRLTRDLAHLTVAELQTCSQEGYRLARGLGKNVTVLGLSLGGTMAMWLAQVQPVDLVVPVAPFLQPIGFSQGFGTTSMRLLNALPNQYWYWDPRVRANQKPDYAYPGFPTHALAQIVFLGDLTLDAAKKAKPLARNIVLVTNDKESAVNNNVARRLLGEWKSHGATTSEVVLSGLGKPRHDIIDLTTFPDAETLVYPKLESLVVANSPVS
jgi:pimeloyl-ACP methyl ester carboxylesterase